MALLASRSSIDGVVFLDLTQIGRKHIKFEYFPLLKNFGLPI
jgi:hypothetical protein